MQFQDIPHSRRVSAEMESRWQRLGVHRASRVARPSTWSTGWPALDRILPGGGYPLAAVTEWLVEQYGSGELSLLLIALAPRLAERPDDRLVLLNPPYHLNAPALRSAGIDPAQVPVIRCRTVGECVWSVEQLARAGGFVGFILWDDELDMAALRRLQLASENAGCPAFVYRQLAAGRQRSPAALRLVLTVRDGRQRIEILKCRGPAGARLNGLVASKDVPWHLPRPVSGLARISSQPADNDIDHAFAHGESATPVHVSAENDAPENRSG